MERSYTPKYAYKLKYAYKVYGDMSSPMPFSSSYGSPSSSLTARKLLLAYNRSIQSDGVNFHLGRFAAATGLVIYRQKDKVVTAQWPPTWSVTWKNPQKKFISRRKIKALKLATRMAYRVFKHVQTHGYAIPIPQRTPPLVKKYVKMILEANKIKWSEKL